MAKKKPDISSTSDSSRFPKSNQALDELRAAYADARDLIQVYRNLRYAPTMQAKAARLFDALKQICEESAN